MIYTFFSKWYVCIMVYFVCMDDNICITINMLHGFGGLMPYYGLYSNVYYPYPLTENVLSTLSADRNVVKSWSHQIWLSKLR